MADFEVPGLAIAVVQNDALVFASGYGVRQQGQAAPVDPDTLIAIGSISTSFTALRLVMLVDEGRLSWDDGVIDQLPAFQPADAYVTREITVRDLLVHRVGLAEVSGGALRWPGSSSSWCCALTRRRHLPEI